MVVMMDALFYVWPEELTISFFLATLSSLTQLSLSCSLDASVIFWSHIY